MIDFAVFSDIPPIGHLYFFYGLSFLLLGLFIVLKIKTSDLKLANHLQLLAWFGFTHGTHEWLELYLLLKGRYVLMHEVFWVKMVAVFVAVLSFLFLLLFGLSLISLTHNSIKKWLKGIPAILFLFWCIYLLNTGFSIGHQLFEQLEILTRKTFGFVGGLLTAYGLIMYSLREEGLGIPVSRKLFYAGVIFLLYGIFAGLFPSRIAVPYFQVPVEGLRGLCAVLITYFVVRALNIFDTETRRSLEQQVRRLARYEKLAPLGRLAAGTAHEINNPLTSISLNVQMLRDELEGMDNHEIRRRVDSIEKNTDRVAAITKDLLQFSRITEPVQKPVNIHTVIDEALSLLKNKLRNVIVHKTLLNVSNVMGDAVQLTQVFINILTNSIQAIPESGHINIECSHSDSWVKIKIADTGTGISQENLLKVFDPFFSTKEVGSGTGLGLSLCYGIINQHNGEIDIESREGLGTTVTVRLPAANGKNAGKF
ncbi:MAG: GHKL domain-containing protein [Nitrospirae bacterium]|nr:GHKL domain-containing protein [Nitrospirota bacterium]